MKKWIVLVLLLIASPSLTAQQGTLFNLSSVGAVAGNPVTGHTACFIVTTNPTALILFAEATADSPQTDAGIALTELQNNGRVLLSFNDNWTSLDRGERLNILRVLRRPRRDTDAVLFVSLSSGSYCASGFESIENGPAGTISVQISDVSKVLPEAGLIPPLNPIETDIIAGILGSLADKLQSLLRTILQVCDCSLGEFQDIIESP